MSKFFNLKFIISILCIIACGALIVATWNSPSWIHPDNAPIWYKRAYTVVCSALIVAFVAAICKHIKKASVVTHEENPMNVEEDKKETVEKPKPIQVKCFSTEEQVSLYFENPENTDLSKYTTTAIISILDKICSDPHCTNKAKRIINVWLSWGQYLHAWGSDLKDAANNSAQYITLASDWVTLLTSTDGAYKFRRFIPDRIYFSPEQIYTIDVHYTTRGDLITGTHLPIKSIIKLSAPDKLKLINYSIIYLKYFNRIEFTAEHWHAISESDSKQIDDKQTLLRHIYWPKVAVDDKLQLLAEYPQLAQHKPFIDALCADGPGVRAGISYSELAAHVKRMLDL